MIRLFVIGVCFLFCLSYHEAQAKPFSSHQRVFLIFSDQSFYFWNLNRHLKNFIRKNGIEPILIPLSKIEDFPSLKAPQKGAEVAGVAIMQHGAPGQIVYRDYGVGGKSMAQEVAKFLENYELSEQLVTYTAACEAGRCTMNQAGQRSSFQDDYSSEMSRLLSKRNVIPVTLAHENLNLFFAIGNGTLTEFLLKSKLAALLAIQPRGGFVGKIFNNVISAAAFIFGSALLMKGQWELVKALNFPYTAASSHLSAWGSGALALGLVLSASSAKSGGVTAVIENDTFKISGKLPTVRTALSQILTPGETLQLPCAKILNKLLPSPSEFQLSPDLVDSGAFPAIRN